jgi:hypothetical protein
LASASRPRNDVFVLSEVILPQPRGELMEKLARSGEGKSNPRPTRRDHPLIFRYLEAALAHIGNGTVVIGCDDRRVRIRWSVGLPQI